jgi:hypothetical protein
MGDDSALRRQRNHRSQRVQSGRFGQLGVQEDQVAPDAWGTAKMLSRT